MRNPLRSTQLGLKICPIGENRDTWLLRFWQDSPPMPAGRGGVRDEN
ncbi:MAG: hypothetical protein OXN96_07545 [Bryobacterales bacterium]|nr:hypothetical protein [Bryobacterales bacterium]